MKKKILKGIAIFVILIFGVLIGAPFFLQTKITDIIKNKVNSGINATFNFEDADLSLFSNFPNAKITFQDISLINKIPFEGDTLFTSKEMELKMSIGELFKGANDAISITSLKIDRAHLNIKINEDQKANFDIAKETETNSSDSPDEGNFMFSMESYVISNSRINYDDLASGMLLEMTELNHGGKGDLSSETSELDTHTTALVSFVMDSTNYLNKNKVQLDALIGIDLIENKYSFLKNKALVNQLPIVFEGSVKVNDNNQEVNISFNTPSSDFKNFLAIIPEIYSKNIEDVKTTGNFTVAGEFKGIVDEEHLPKFNIKMNSENASFKYPDLPKSVRNVVIDAEIANTTGIIEDTYIDIRKFAFKIDEDAFIMTSKITGLLDNMKINASMKGNMNLANISKAYPVPTDLDLKGILNADIRTAFDMASVEKKQYENTRTNGIMNLKGFEYRSVDLSNPIKINTTTISFNPKEVSLQEFDGVLGNTDFNVNGTIQNLLGFMFNEENVEGNFNLISDTFNVNDFMVEESDITSSTSTSISDGGKKEEKIKIPAWLDCSINASANTVLYDNLILKNVSGNLRIKDEKVTLSNMTSSMFDGKLAFNGEVSTKNETPTFTMKLGMDGFKIGETFKALELLDVLAPIAGVLKGKFDSEIEISGNLNDSFTPDLATISGNLLAELLAADINSNQGNVLSALSTKLEFIKTDKLDLKGLKTALTFEDGKVKVKPFTINYEDIAIKVSGNHTFDKQLNYEAILDVPSKYLGNEVSSLIAKMDDKELENLTIPVTAKIGGGYADPTVTTDLTSGVTNLTNQLVEIQKQRLLNQGKEEVQNLIGGVLSGNSQTKDSTSDGVTQVLGELLGASTKELDTSVTEKDTVAPKIDPVQKAAKNILGGLLGGKKKKDAAKNQKDSVN